VGHRGQTGSKVIYLPAALVQSPTFLPPVCARHGRRATDTRRVTFYSRAPLWTVLLFFVAILIALIVILAVRKDIKSPAWRLCDQCRADRSQRLLAGWSLMLLGPVAVGLFDEALSLTGDAEGLFLVIGMFACVLTGFVVLTQATWTVLFAADVVTGGADLRLRKAHPAFVAALPPPPPLPMYVAPAAMSGYPPPPAYPTAPGQFPSPG
jgi:hypothetical protein